MVALAAALAVPILPTRAEEWSWSLWSELTGYNIEYSSGTEPDLTLQGYYSLPRAESLVARPGIVIFPAWFGVQELDKHRADELAQYGYATLVADLYGKGVRPQNKEEAAGNMTALVEDSSKLMERAEAALLALHSLKGVNSSKTGANGYCFGGRVALTLARKGLLEGVVAFHPALDAIPGVDVGAFAARGVQIHHGDEDRDNDAEFVKVSAELRDSKVAKWDVHRYGGAFHGFSDPAQGHYDERATKLSHNAMFGFYDELWDMEEEIQRARKKKHPLSETGVIVLLVLLCALTMPAWILIWPTVSGWLAKRKDYWFPHKEAEL